MDPKTAVDNLEHIKVSSPCRESKSFLVSCFVVTLAIDCGDFQRAVVTNRVEYKKLRSVNCRVLFNNRLLFLKKNTSPNCSSCRAVRSCKCVPKLTITWK